MLFAVRFHDRMARAELRAEHLRAHIEWLEEHKDSVLIGGSLRKELGDNPVGGLWLVEAQDKEAVEELIQFDPFSIHGLRECHEIFFWSKAFPERKVLV